VRGTSRAVVNADQFNVLQTITMRPITFMLLVLTLLSSGCVSHTKSVTGQAYLLDQAIFAPYENPGIDRRGGTHSLDLANALIGCDSPRGVSPLNVQKVQNQSTDPTP
jgi:hypothetical protein